MIAAEPPQIAPPDSKIGLKTILFVEDEWLMRAFVPVVLRRAGHNVISAVDGIEGSILFARAFETIDLLITDLSLPGMTGLELASYIRASRPDLPILFASGSVHALAENPADRFENSAFLPKPFTTEELLTAIDKLLTD